MTFARYICALISLAVCAGAAAQEPYLVSTKLVDEMAHIELTNQTTSPIEIVWWGARTNNAGWFDYYDVRADCGKDPKLIPQGRSHTLDVGLTTALPTVRVFAVGFSNGTIVADAPYPKYVQLLHKEMLADLEKFANILRSAPPANAFQEVLAKVERLQADATKRWESVRSSRTYWPNKNPVPSGELAPVSNCEARLIDKFIDSVNGSNYWVPDSSGNFPHAKILLEKTIPALRERLEQSNLNRRQHP